VAALRLVLDTDILLSGVAHPASIPRKIVAAWRSGPIDVVLSACTLKELGRVLPQLTHGHAMEARTAEIDDLIDSLALQYKLVVPLPSVTKRRGLSAQRGL
jgi:predicted nucleic acid-binding protein